MERHNPVGPGLAGTLPRRLRFLGSLAYRSIIYPDKGCPYCAGARTAVAGRKFKLMQVRRCSDCGLMFRWPKDHKRASSEYYQIRYTEPQVTDLPGEAELAQLLTTNFSGTERDRSSKIALLRAIKPPPALVLDFGCSWGYALHQLERAGYTAIGFEISEARAAFGRGKLGAEIISSYGGLNSLPGCSFDVVYSHHVLEHLARLTDVFVQMRRLLKPGGLLFIFAPNCGDGKGNLRRGWKPIVGEKHSMALDTVFFRNVLPKYGFDVAALTFPFKVDELLAGVAEHPEDGPELLVCGRLK